MKQPLKNAGALLIGDAGSRVIGFGVTVYLARILEPAGFGLITIGMAVLGYLLLAASPGIQTVEVRNVAASREVNPGRVGAVLSLRVALALLLLPAAWLAAAFVIEDPGTRTLVLLYAVALLPLALLLDWFFSGRERFGVVAGARLLNAGVYGVSVVLLVRSAGDIILAPAAFILGAGAAAAMLLIRYRRECGPVAFRWDPPAWRRILGENVPVGLATLLGQNVTNLPPIVIGLVAGASAAGQFSAAMKLVFVLLMLDRLLNALLLPVMSRYVASRPEDVPRLFTAVGRSVLLVILPCAILCAVLASELVPLIFGEGYGEAAVLFRILVPYVVLTLLSSLHVMMLVAAGKERRYTLLMIVSSAVSALLVILLALVAGPAGAGWAVVGGEAVALMLLAREARPVTAVPIRQIILRPAAAALPMAACLLWLSWLHPLIAAAVGIVVFGLSVVLLGGVSGEDLRFLRGRVL